MGAPEILAVAVAQWQSTGLWLQRLGVQIPSVTPTLSGFVSSGPSSVLYAHLFGGLSPYQHRLPRIAIESWPCIGLWGLPREGAGNGQAVVAWRAGPVVVNSSSPAVATFGCSAVPQMRDATIDPARIVMINPRDQTIGTL